MEYLIFIILLAAVSGVIWSRYSSRNREQVSKPTIKETSEDNELDFTSPFPEPTGLVEDGYHLIVAVGTVGKPKDYNAPASDLENWPEVVSLSYRIFSRDLRLVVSKDLLIKTTSKPSDAVLKEYGIPGVILAQKGIPASEAYQQLVADSAHCLNIVGHNIKYLRSVLKANFIRNGIKYPFANIKNTCTMRESTKLAMIPSPSGDGYKLPTLEQLIAACYYPWEDAKSFKIGVVQSAAWKAEATAKCFIHLLNKNIV